MAVGDQILVVVSILEGKKFPKRPRHKILIETKFDGETLSTDPIDHNESPEFSTELAWELNKKTLHQHRLQRTPIKVQCYALDVLTSQKESVGYIILDLRSAPQKPERAQWYPLLSSKYQKLKPEIKLQLCLEDDSQPKPAEKPKASPGHQQPQPKRKDPPAPVVTSAGSNNLQPLLNNDEGFYEIGPKTADNKVFVMSVTIGFASNLAKVAHEKTHEYGYNSNKESYSQENDTWSLRGKHYPKLKRSILIPSSFKLSDPKLGGGFYFYYSLLGNDVTNEVFHDLLQPNFPAERASVRINSTFETLKQFFNSHHGLEVHLCSGDQSLGMASVSLQSLLTQEAQLLEMPAVIEALFKLRPMNTRQEMPSVPDDTDPVVCVSVSLRYEQQGVLPGAGGFSPGRAKIGSATKTPKKTETQRGTPKTTPKPLPNNRGPNNMGAETLAPNVNGSPSTPARPSTSTPEKATNHGRTGEDTKSPAVPSPIKNQRSPKRQPKKQTQPKPPTSAPSTTANQVPYTHGGMNPSADLDTRHFCFSIDLRTISDLDVNAPINCFLRYTYPFFGSSAPVMTSPPVEVSRHMQVLLPKSFCAFDFAASPRLLQETFMGIPLVVEVWHKDQMAGSLLLGTAAVTLGHILAGDKAKMLSGGVTGYRQIYSERVPVITAHDPTRKIGELHVVLGLEDFGPVNPQQLLAARSGLLSLSNTTSSIESSQASSAIPLAQPQRSPPHQPEPPTVTDPRATSEYQAAMELEMWKEQQEEIFQAQLHEKETLHMRTLAEEWKRRDKERELLVKKKVEEYSKLEEKLKGTVADLEKRERQLAANEAQALRLKEDLEREHERRLQELKEAARRMKEDCAHQVEMERGKVRDLEQQKQRLVEQLYAAEKRYQDKENEFMSYKESQLTKPEVRLQSELNLLKVEKVELERKLDTANKSKIHYKQQWGRALREVARLKQQEQAIARVRLKKQEQELEHMRLRYLAAEEKEVVKASEKNELDEIKQELLRLKQQEQEKLRLSESTSQNQGPSTQRLHQSHEPHSLHSGMGSSFNEAQENIDNRIAKLIEERDTLLQTGVYATDDRIIVELDRQIRDAIASKG